MIQKIMLGIAALMLLCSTICYAEDLSPYLDGRAVNVIETDNSIDIYARYSMEGKAAEYVIPRTQITYEKAFPRAIKECWEGEYDGKPVNVHLERLAADSNQKKISVQFNIVHDTSCYSYALVGDDLREIHIYSGDGRSVSSVFYSYKEYMATAAHEFGHCIGLGDCYNDEKVSDWLVSPMNDSFHTMQAQAVDYYILLTHRTWENNGVFIYSQDSDIEQFNSK